MNRTVRIGTRASALALTQSNTLLKKLKRNFNDVNFELIPIKTAGDLDKTMGIFQKQVGVFCKELETHLIKKEIDIAIHSLKDLPTDMPKQLVIGAYSKRMKANDALITTKGLTLLDLPHKAIVATASVRRIAQVRRIRPDLKIKTMRGNIDTRLQKLANAQCDAIILALAGIKRLKIKNIKYTVLPLSQFIPAPGQGILALQCRKDKFILKLLNSIDDNRSREQAVAERVCLSKLEGGCQIPAGIYAYHRNNELFLRAAVYNVRNGELMSASMRGLGHNANKIGLSVASDLLKSGAKKWVQNARNR